MDELVRDDGLSLPRPMEYVRSEIQVLAVAMEGRLREKELTRGKTWKEMPAADLWAKIPGQVQHLRAAIETNDHELIKKKCADIANYCMFIHDNVGK